MTRSSQLRLEVPVPTPNDDEVLVRIEAAGGTSLITWTPILMDLLSDLFAVTNSLSQRLCLETDGSAAAGVFELETQFHYGQSAVRGHFQKALVPYVPRRAMKAAAKSSQQDRPSRTSEWATKSPSCVFLDAVTTWPALNVPEALHRFVIKAPTTGVATMVFSPTTPWCRSEQQSCCHEV